MGDYGEHPPAEVCALGTGAADDWEAGGVWMRDAGVYRAGQADWNDADGFCYRGSDYSGGALERIGFDADSFPELSVLEITAEGAYRGDCFEAGGGAGGGGEGAGQPLPCPLPWEGECD